MNLVYMHVIHRKVVSIFHMCADLVEQSDSSVRIKVIEFTFFNFFLFAFYILLEFCTEF